jgi:hypothetical protein
MDLLKAIFLASGILAAVFLIPILIAVMAYALGFAALVLVVWFILKVIRDEGRQDHNDPPGD